MKKRFLCLALALVLLGSLGAPAAAAEDVLDTYIAEKITSGMTLREKLEVICQFVAEYDYSPYASTMKDMLATGGGDSRAGSEILLAFCQKLGITASLRPSDRDGNGTQVNVLVQGDGVYYQLETGFQELAPRPYEITERTSLFSYRHVEGGIEVYQYDGASPSTLTVPDAVDGKTVVAIGERFLASCGSIEKVTLPSAVKRIGRDAFNGCGKLHTLDIPASVTEIGERAFSGCDSLKQLTSSSPKYQVSDHILYNADRSRVIAAPYSRTALLPASVTSIAPYAFHCSGNLKNVVISSGVTDIGEGAFAECGALRGITFQGVEPEMGKFLFYAVTAEVYAAWKSEQDISGELTWKSYTARANFSADYDEQADVTELHVLVWADGEIRIPMKVTQLMLDVTLEESSAVLDVALQEPAQGYVFLKKTGDGSFQVLPQTMVTDGGIALRITESCQLMIAEKSLDFQDVTGGNRFRDAIDYVTARGIMKGMTDGSFAPNDLVNRRMVAMILWHMAGDPQVEGTSPFPDITGGRYLMPVLWAHSAGIISGYQDGTFRPGDSISRQHFAVMMYRFAKDQGFTLQTVSDKQLSEFPDYGQINPRFAEACQWAVSCGLISGRTDGSFDPEGFTTRAQMAMILNRFLKQVYDSE